MARRKRGEVLVYMYDFGTTSWGFKPHEKASWPGEFMGLIQQSKREFAIVDMTTGLSVAHISASFSEAMEIFEALDAVEIEPEQWHNMTAGRRTDGGKWHVELNRTQQNIEIFWTLAEVARKAINGRPIICSFH